MTMANAIEPGRTKPINLRIIFILYAAKVLLAAGFYIAFTIGGLEVGGITATTILYTAIGYAVVFAATVTSILKRNIVALRACIVLDFLISIPAKAYIGFAIGIICMTLTFTGSVRKYFE